MEKKDFNTHDVDEVNEKMNSTVSTLKEEMYSEVSSEVNVCTPDNDVDATEMKSNETVPYLLQDNVQLPINDSETPFCFVGIKMEYPDDYESEASSANSELNHMSCVKIKMECEEEVDSCESDNMLVSIDMNKDCDSSSVVRGCDMGYSSTEFIRGIECQEYPILRVNEEEGENTDMQIAANSRNLCEPVELGDSCKNEMTRNSSYNVNSSRLMLMEMKDEVEKVSSQGVYPFPQTEMGNEASGFKKTRGTSQRRRRSMKYEKQKVSKDSSDHEMDLSPMEQESEFDSECRLPNSFQRHAECVPPSSEGSSTENDLKIHTETHSKGRSFTCTMCQVSFNWKHHLQNHMRTHTGEKPFSCDVCQKSFREAGTLSRHLLTHTGVKPFSCDVCHMSFSQKGNCKSHMRSHSGEKPFMCEVCYKAFIAKVHLTRHMQTHSGEKPFVCDICHKSYSEKGHLKQHILSHTGDKPFLCDVCHASFSRNSVLKIHQRIHTGEKPFMCDICQASFSQTGSLKRHVRTHSEDKL